MLTFSLKEVMDATNEMVTNYAQKSLIALSMGGLGSISRLDGEVFRCSMTFGSADKKSVTGHIPVSKLNICLIAIHDSQSLG